MKFSTKDLLWLTVVVTLVCWNLVPEKQFKRGTIVRNKQTAQIGILLQSDSNRDNWLVFISGWYHQTDFRPGHYVGYSKVQYDNWPKKDLIEVSELIMYSK